MAGRKERNIVDYFPHRVEHGKTMFILENKYPFKGYTVWFKTLELLGRSENHFIDCRKEEDWEYLSAYMKVSSDELQLIYDTLASLEAIHPELWQNKVIWSLNFVKEVMPVYAKRGRKPKDFLTIIEFLGISCTRNYNKNGIVVTEKPISVPEMTQSRVEYSRVEKENNIKEKNQEEEIEKYIPPDVSFLYKEEEEPKIPEGF